jgi:hypothetical protein
VNPTIDEEIQLAIEPFGKRGVHGPVFDRHAELLIVLSSPLLVVR